MSVGQYFLNEDEILVLLMAELPEGVYAQDLANNIDPSKNSYSSAELRAHANLYDGIYETAEDVYNNFFITTLQPDGVGQWEVDYFGAIQDASQGFAARKANLTAKFRATGGLSLPYINSLISGLLTPLGLTWAILPLSGQVNENGDTGAWILGYSSLGQNTYLGGLDPIIGEMMDFTPLDCSLNYAAAGITADQLAEIQTTAYQYEVRIYGNASSATLTALDNLLKKFEPARSDHVIMNNATPPVPPS